MKDYLNQFYNDGLATTFYLKPLRYLEKKIKSKKLLKVLSLIIKIIYSILVIAFAIIMFYDKWPL